MRIGNAGGIKGTPSFPNGGKMGVAGMVNMCLQVHFLISRRGLFFWHPNCKIRAYGRVRVRGFAV